MNDEPGPQKGHSSCWKTEDTVIFTVVGVIILCVVVGVVAYLSGYKARESEFQEKRESEFGTVEFVTEIKNGDPRNYVVCPCGKRTYCHPADLKQAGVTLHTLGERKAPP